jgi:trehalose-phosphatase
MTPADSPPDTAAMRPCRNLPNALEHIDRLCRRLEGRRPALFLDYDGTLAPIALRPELAVMGQAMREVLGGLAGQLPVAIVSGRDRSDVEALVGIDGLVYAGNHGFDIAGGGLAYNVGDDFKAELEQAQQEIIAVLTGVSGVLVEPKRTSLALHYRLVAPDEVDRVEAAVDSVAGAHPRLRLMRGRKILELLPDIAWDKGHAVTWLLGAMQLEGPETLAFYIGDDTTDEDAFRALAGYGVAIRVLAPENQDTIGNDASDAEYRLESVDQVRRLLEIIGTAAGGRAVPDGVSR